MTNGMRIGVQAQGLTVWYLLWNIGFHESATVGSNPTMPKVCLSSVLLSLLMIPLFGVSRHVASDHLLSLLCINDA